VTEILSSKDEARLGLVFQVVDSLHVPRFAKTLTLLSGLKNLLFRLKSLSSPLRICALLGMLDKLNCKRVSLEVLVSAFVCSTFILPKLVVGCALFTNVSFVGVRLTTSVNPDDGYKTKPANKTKKAKTNVFKILGICSVNNRGLMSNLCYPWLDFS
jgi:hypothetical protein